MLCFCSSRMLSRIQLMPAEINTMDLCPSGKLQCSWQSEGAPGRGWRWCWWIQAIGADSKQALQFSLAQGFLTDFLVCLFYFCTVGSLCFTAYLSCARGSLGWILGRVSSQKGWLGTGMGCPGRVTIPGGVGEKAGCGS